MSPPKPRLNEGKSWLDYSDLEQASDEYGFIEFDDGGESILSGLPRETGGERDDAPHLER